MKYIYLGIFIMVSGLHLYASFIKNQGFRNITKGMILLSLLGFYTTSTTDPSPFIVAALVLGMNGDLLLTNQGKIFFVLGGFSFGFSHLAFLVAYTELSNPHDLPVWLIVLVALFYLVIATYVLHQLHKLTKSKLFYIMSIYLYVNGAMNAFAVYRLLAQPSLSTVITFVGATLFFISDTILLLLKFDKRKAGYSHFGEMLTYILGQFLIILGLVL